ncbi:MAG: hypothetical protein M3Q65_20420 [Chloroflexota bacterium]|nr:hypothetical protein [Chloroflexota bacterium]
MEERQEALERVTAQLAALGDELWRLGEREKAAKLILDWVSQPIRLGPVRGAQGPGFYDRITALSDDLWRAGEREWAAKLIWDVASGATGGEIAMALQMHLGTLRRSDVARQLHLEARIDELLARLDEWHKSSISPR